MKTGEAGIRLIQYWESLILVAYPDPASQLASRLQVRGLWQRVLKQGYAAIPEDLRDLNGNPWTIGYGDTGPQVTPHSVITESEANRRLRERLTREFEPALNAALKREVTQNEFDALISLTYNIGVGAMKSSTLIHMINYENDPLGVGLQFERWIKAGGKDSVGLKRRRLSEMYVAFNEPVEKAISDALLFKGL